VLKGLQSCHNWWGLPACNGATPTRQLASQQDTPMIEKAFILAAGRGTLRGTE